VGTPGSPGPASAPGAPGQWTRPTGKPEREKVPDRIEVSSTDLAGRTARCRNEADILGLKDAWHESHVQNCLARKAPKAKSAAR
jgi:hypothetical protein